MKTASVNLLTKDDFSSTSFGKISTWALSAGRWIVIVTELIVIIAFIARFKIDRDISSLSDEISQKIAIVEAYSSFESNFRTVQSQLSTVNQAFEQQQNYDQILDEIEKALPPDVTISSIEIDQSKVNIKAFARTEPSMATVKQSLQQSSLFNQVNLIKVKMDKDSQSKIQFEIEAKLI